jgi:hypothetical protein
LVSIAARAQSTATSFPTKTPGHQSEGFVREEGSVDRQLVTRKDALIDWSLKSMHTKTARLTGVKRTTRHFVLILWGCALGIGLSVAAQTTNQQSDDDLRNIVPEKFVEKRRKKSTARSRTTATYKRIAAAEGLTAGASAKGGGQPFKSADKQFAQLGLTLWRLRKSVPTDSNAKIVVAGRDGVAEWTPIRVEAGKPLEVDDLVRLSIESSVEGYLYVIDRGQYRGGTMSDPKLIFPTTRTRGGDNRVKPGRLIEIPAQDDRPSYFHLRSSRGELVSELLTIVVAKEPIADLTEQITSQPLTLDKALVANWQNMWGTKSEHFELAGGQGMPWTIAEQEAGADMSRELTQDDAPPQTIFRLAHKPNSPVLIDLPLSIKASPVIR